MQKSSTLTYNLNNDQKSRNIKYHSPPLPLHDQLVIEVDDRNVCHFAIRPAGPGSVLGKDKILASAKGLLKGPQSEFAHVLFLFSTGYLVVSFLLSTQRLEVCMLFCLLGQLSSGSLLLLSSLVCLIVSNLLWNWMKPQAENPLTGLWLMPCALAGWTHSHNRIQVEG